MRPQRKIRLKFDEQMQFDRVFKWILVAVDGSESSFRAARVAARLAKRNEAELLVVSAIQRPAYPFMQSPTEALFPAVAGLQDYYRYASKNADVWMVRERL